MKKLLILAAISLSLSCCSQKNNCKEFKIGEFIYADNKLPEKIIRTEKEQIEINPKTGIEIHSSIEWTSDCSYILTYKKILNCPDDVKHMIGQKIYVNIIETKENRMKVLAKSNRIDNEIEFVKIN